MILTALLTILGIHEQFHPNRQNKGRDNKNAEYHVFRIPDRSDGVSQPTRMIELDTSRAIIHSNRL